jgi:stress response protein YsnF
VVGVQVAPEQVDTVARALEAGAERIEMSTPPRFGEDVVVELSETAEQLIVEKETVLREEIVMRVQAKERVEEIYDTVREPRSRSSGLSRVAAQDPATSPPPSLP